MEYLDMGRIAGRFRGETEGNGAQPAAARVRWSSYLARVLARELDRAWDFWLSRAQPAMASSASSMLSPS